MSATDSPSDGVIDPEQVHFQICEDLFDILASLCPAERIEQADIFASLRRPVGVIRAAALDAGGGSPAWTLVLPAVLQQRWLDLSDESRLVARVMAEVAVQQSE